MAFASSSNSTAESSYSSMDESYLLWLLSDSNLPTGGFVASSGLESYVSHGFLHLPPASSAPSSSFPSAEARKSKSKEDQMAEATLRFLQDSLGSYARSALPFLREAHSVTCWYLDFPSPDGESGEAEGRKRLELCLSQLAHLEQTYHSLSLNHVLRRASRAQGIALLTLYARSFSSVPFPSSETRQEERDVSSAQVYKEVRSQRAAGLIEALKKHVRLASVKGGAPYGHLPTCWAVFTACLGVGLRSATSLHLFLQARSVLSSSVRLNTLGPYLAHGLLLGPVKDILQSLEEEVNSEHDIGQQGKSEAKQGARWEESRASTTDTERSPNTSASTRVDKSAFEWDWEEEGDWYADELSAGHHRPLSPQGPSGLRPPVNTWPLGEIVQGRHDALHSRLFNS
ncbi:hypothetical protein BCV69DRAFT_65002 [Microstroma glucosiphilum]|uniref:Uncharacterized protein n=1 Tax=Pseudomicrostroma glucosiphilum TaxID=1684307 RepID=A0A316U0C1_9BASI|nr:hypothetical protein BCV69DRAFT_65002 [Pseudomicrostroma glucosiphilum]PWN18859.1 hypothetical protein BCV69DRAFT_65002 [Pseudomicrostroma glucosiphilum]